jgi:hypothetical protein
VYVPGTVNADEQQMGSIFSAIGKALGGVIKIGEHALGLDSGGGKQLAITVAPGQAPAASITAKPSPLEQAAADALGNATKAAGKVPTWVWVAGGGVALVAVLAMMNGRRR